MLGCKSKLALVGGRQQLKHLTADVSAWKEGNLITAQVRPQEKLEFRGRCWPAWSAGKSEFRRAVPLLSEAVGLDVLSAKGLPEVLVSDLLATF